jgi:hypothetical protein
VRNELSEEAQERGRQIAQCVAEEMWTELAQIAWIKCRGTADNDGNVISFLERQEQGEGQQARNAGDADYRGWLLDAVEDSESL